MNTEDIIVKPPSLDSEHLTVADRWILSRLARLSDRVTDGLERFQFGEVARDLYEFFWADYCDWYIELAKGRLSSSDASDANTARQVLVYVLDQSLRLLHPFMPFITDEIWRKLPLDRTNLPASIMVATWPDPSTLKDMRNVDAESTITYLKSVVTAARAVRAQYGLNPKQEIEVTVKASADIATLLNRNAPLITSLGKISALQVSPDAQKPQQAAVTIDEGLEIYIPLAGLVDYDAEKSKLGKKREKIAQDLDRFERKLSNAGFLAKASPDIIEKDRASAKDLTVALELIDAQITELDSTSISE
jgi:valyl-tRNA synthetase